MKITIRFYSIIFLFIAQNIFSQNIQGKAYYITKTTNEFDFTNRNIPEEVKNRIKEEAKKMSSKTFILEFNKTTSIYKEETELDESNMTENQFGSGMRMMLNAQDSGILFKDISTKSFINQKEIYGKTFLIKDSLSTYGWELENETKIIGKYTCYRAKGFIIIPKISKGFPGNTEPKKEGENEKEQILVTVWYSTDIPIQNGPAKLWGLPGLILEVEMGNTKIICSKIELANSSKIIEIDIPKKGKLITQEKFDELMREKMEEMKSNSRARGNMYGGGRN